MRFLRAFVLGVVCAAGIFLAMAALVNPRGVFPWQAFPQPLPNYRARKLAVLAATAGDFGGLVLGSSRSMKLDPVVLQARTGLRYFNLAMLGADPEDYPAVWRYYLQKHRAPQALVIGIDLNGFSEAEASANFRRNPELIAALEGRARRPVEQLRDLLREAKGELTVDYAKDIGASIHQAFSPQPENFQFRSDGVLVYNRFDQAIAAGTYDRAARITDCSDRYLKELAAPDPARLRLVEQVIRDARTKGVRITVFITPHHPSLMSRIDGDSLFRRYLTDLTGAVRAWQGAYAVEVRDLSRIESFGGDSADWYDCTHFGAANAARVVDALGPFPKE